MKMYNNTVIQMKTAFGFLLLSQTQIYLLDVARKHKFLVVFILKFNCSVKSFHLKLKICNTMPERVI